MNRRGFFGSLIALAAAPALARAFAPIAAVLPAAPIAPLPLTGIMGWLPVNTIFMHPKMYALLRKEMLDDPLALEALPPQLDVYQDPYCPEESFFGMDRDATEVPFLNWHGVHFRTLREDLEQAMADVAAAHEREMFA